VSTTNPAPQPPLTFEQAIEQLESIVDRIERGEIGLEDSIKQYEQGVALIRRCKEILTHAEQRVEELNKTASTTPTSTTV